MAPPKDIARSYPKRGLTADVGFRSEPKFCGDGSTSLDGTSDYLESTLTTALGSGFSVSLWFLKRTTTGANNYLWSSGSAGGGSFISLSCTSTNALATYDQANFLTSSLTANLNQWHHAVVTVGTGANSYTVYLDGIGESLANTASPNITNGDFEIGRYSLGSTHYHDGLVSDVRIYDQVLTQDQVREIYNNPGLTIPTGLSASNLRHRYKLETDYVDTGASGDDLTAFGSPSFTVNRPQLPRGLDLTQNASTARVYTGRAVEFDGSADYLATETSSALGDTFTITAWIKRNSAATLDYVVNVGNPSGAGNAISISITNANPGLLYFFDNGTSVNTTNKVEYNTWYHVALTVAPGAGTAKLYMNGIDGTPAHSVNVNITDTTFEIGRYLGASHWFYGWISDVRVYNQTLTADQVKELYHYPERVLPTGASASNLIHRWALSDYNDTGGTGGRYFQDSAGSNAMEDKSSASMEFAQPVPCPQLGLQQSATRIHFPGATVTGSATIPALGTAASLSCWFFWDNSSRTSYPIAVGTVNSTTDGLNIRIDTSGNVTTYENTDFDSGLNVTEGTWNHIVIVSQTASPYWKCFVNNVEATSPAAKSAAINITSTNAHVGTNGVNFGAAGIVADAAIWSSELSDANVAALYNSGVMGADVSQVDSSNLVAWWKCDDLTSCKDFSGNGRAMSYSTALSAASFPENASGSTIVGDFSMKRKGVSVLNPTATPEVTGNLIRAEIANDGSLNPNPANGGYTVSAFIRLEQQGLGGSTWVPMILGNSTAVSSPNYLLVYFPGYTASTPIKLSIGDGTITNRIYDYPSALPSPEEWHQVAFTIDFSTSPTTFRLYQDGALVSTQATHNHSASDLGDLSVGSYWSGNGNFPGAIACVKIYQTKLSDNEIKQIYNSDLRLIKGLANE